MDRVHYKYVLCDIDGTLADLSHRAHLVRQKPKDWPAFLKGVSDDAVIWPVYTVIEALKKAGYHVVLMSGREEIVRPQTEEWLRINELVYDELLMRAKRDYRADEIVKRELFEARFSAAERGRILGVFDDRPKVIRMWRDIGLKVFDVGNGVEF